MVKKRKPSPGEMTAGDGNRQPKTAPLPDLRQTSADRVWRTRRHLAWWRHVADIFEVVTADGDDLPLDVRSAEELEQLVSAIENGKNRDLVRLARRLSFAYFGFSHRALDGVVFRFIDFGMKEAIGTPRENEVARALAARLFPPDFTKPPQSWIPVEGLQDAMRDFAVSASELVSLCTESQFLAFIGRGEPTKARAYLLGRLWNISTRTAESAFADALRTGNVIFEIESRERQMVLEPRRYIVDLDEESFELALKQTRFAPEFPEADKAAYFDMMRRTWKERRAQRRRAKQ